MAKLLLISYYWPPSGGAGVHRWLSMSRILVEQGVEVWVLTVDSTQASYLGRDEALLTRVHPSLSVVRTPSFEPLRWYQRISGRPLPQGGGTGLPSGWRGRILKMIRSHFFVPDPRRGWVRYAVKAASELIDREAIQNVVISSPPHSSQLIGLRLKEQHDINLLVDFRDPWTDLYYNDAFDIPRSAQRRQAQWERAVLESADHVITVGKRLGALLQSKVDQALKVTVVHNGFEGSLLPAAPSLATKDTVKLLYTGKLTDQFDVSALLRALAHVSRAKENRAIELVIAGPVSEGIKGHIASAGVACHLLGTLDHAEIEPLQNDADLLLLVIPLGSRNDIILTGKLFEYLRTQKPILCLGPIAGDAADVLMETNTGYTFEHQDEQGLIGFLSDFLQDQIEWNPDSQAIAKYSRKMQAGRIIPLLN